MRTYFPNGVPSTHPAYEQSILVMAAVGYVNSRLVKVRPYYISINNGYVIISI
ncbi:hypothetical protein [Lysinibacillus sp. 3P01SB]|uniref:hypothetical protein n=1 Tax=Lysinibacillus sp. 3P01SB TaxID=3132284 RepID=UPI0039A47990